MYGGLLGFTPKLRIRRHLPQSPGCDVLGAHCFENTAKCSSTSGPRCRGSRLGDSSGTTLHSATLASAGWALRSAAAARKESSDSPELGLAPPCWPLACKHEPGCPPPRVGPGFVGASDYSPKGPAAFVWPWPWAGSFPLTPLPSSITPALQCITVLPKINPVSLTF